MRRFVLVFLVGLFMQGWIWKTPMIHENAVQAKKRAVSILAADIEAEDRVVIHFDGALPETISAADIRFEPELAVKSIIVGETSLEIRTGRIDLYRNYRVHIRSVGEKPLRPMGILDQFYSDKPLGYQFENGNTVFRLFAPRALRVELELFDRCEQKTGLRHAMKRDAEGVWELVLPGELEGKYYGYRVWGPEGDGEIFDPDKLIADPYSRAVCTKNTYLHQGKTLIYRDDFDWDGDDFFALQMGRPDHPRSACAGSHRASQFGSAGLPARHLPRFARSQHARWTELSQRPRRECGGIFAAA
ncbi:MAG: hypothetical protein Q9P14_08685 [candidate division KSB1 bacterium]|nr:hypothetical protein [candidate division KSB1 bacterium]